MAGESVKEQATSKRAGENLKKALGVIWGSSENKKARIDDIAGYFTKRERFDHMNPSLLAVTIDLALENKINTVKKIGSFTLDQFYSRYPKPELYKKNFDPSKHSPDENRELMKAIKLDLLKYVLWIDYPKDPETEGYFLGSKEDRLTDLEEMTKSGDSETQPK